MKIKLMGMFLLIGSVANAQTITDLQAEVKQKHGIEIVLNNDPSLVNYITEADSKFFLEDFLAEAEKQELSEGDRKRFFPIRITVQVVPVFWPAFVLRRFPSGPKISFHLHTIKASHISASGTVSSIIKYFPLERTDEAAELELRNRAVRQAIMDKIQYAKEQWVTVESCAFAVVLCSLDYESNINYSRQEQLLQGLINLAKAIESGHDSRSKVNITSMPLSRQDSDHQSWNNHWTVDDEIETDNLILEYMERLRIDAS